MKSKWRTGGREEGSKARKREERQRTWEEVNKKRKNGNK
jgi:hypothetical protein